MLWKHAIEKLEEAGITAELFEHNELLARLVIEDDGHLRWGSWDRVDNRVQRYALQFDSWKRDPGPHPKAILLYKEGHPSPTRTETDWVSC